MNKQRTQKTLSKCDLCNWPEKTWNIPFKSKTIIEPSQFSCGFINELYKASTKKSILIILTFGAHVWIKQKEETKLLSRNCDGCSQLRMCKVRYNILEKGNKVYCPDGTAHLID